jgi:hypothetical protein
MNKNDTNNLILSTFSHCSSSSFLSSSLLDSSFLFVFLVVLLQKMTSNRLNTDEYIDIDVDVDADFSLKNCKKLNDRVH